MARMARLLIGSILAGGFFQSAAIAKPNVAASIKPVHALVSAVTGRISTPKLILSGNTSPHHTALKPSQRRMMEAADVIFHIGGSLEQSLKKALEQRKAAGARIIALIDTPGLALLPVREGGIWHKDEHAHGDEHGIHDPHIWLDPQNARNMTLFIANALSQADPGNAGAYQSNAENYVKQIDKMQTSITIRLAPVRAKPFIVFHDGYQYFEKRFSLNAAGAIAVDPDKRPGARRLHDIRQLIASRGAGCVFAEPQFDVSYVSTVIDGTSARSALLDPIGINLQSGPGAYIQLMDNMANAITECLGGSQ